MKADDTIARSAIELGRLVVLAATALAFAHIGHTELASTAIGGALALLVPKAGATNVPPSLPLALGLAAGALGPALLGGVS